MYNFKEKNKHLRALTAETHAEVDLELLKKIDPRNHNISTFEHAPKRNAEKILYTLLDLATAEDIRNNRRKVEQNRIENEAAEQAEKTEDLKTALENSEEELENLEFEKQELEDEVAELEEKLQEKEAELEAEKKSEPAPEVTKKAQLKKAANSRKKTSIPKSDGKSSKTKTSN